MKVIQLEAGTIVKLKRRGILQGEGSDETLNSGLIEGMKYRIDYVDYSGKFPVCGLAGINTLFHPNHFTKA